MPYFVASLFLSFACGIASIGAESFSYLGENVVLTHGILSVLTIALFLVGIAVAVLANTNKKGELQAPSSLSALACVILLLPQGGFAVGRIVNYDSSLLIMQTVKSFPGASVVFYQGLASLDGDIGYATLESLEAVLNLESVSKLELRSEGGTIDAAISIGELLAEKRLDVFVKDNCESACVVVALSGERLFVAPDAQFGFHRGSAVASTESQIGRFIGNLATEEYISALGERGVPREILSIAEETPAEEMHYLSGEEMVQLGLATIQLE